MILDRQRRVEGRDRRTADMFRDDAAALLDERRRRAEEKPFSSPITSGC
jgi:hypothetical protein